MVLSFMSYWCILIFLSCSRSPKVCIVLYFFENVSNKNACHYLQMGNIFSFTKKCYVKCPKLFCYVTSPQRCSAMLLIVYIILTVCVWQFFGSYAFDLFVICRFVSQ